MATSGPEFRLSRRAFIRSGSLLLAGPLVLRTEAAMALSAPSELRIGLITDLHYADRPPSGTRFYRETPAKLSEALERFERDKTEMVIELGDLVDAADSVDGEKEYLRRIVKDLSAAPGQHHFVVGNHCVYTLTKAEFLEVVERERTYYSFDSGNHHFIILDACFRQDGIPYGRKNSQWTDANLSPVELEWLAADLKATAHKAIVFVHQRLDLDELPGIRNAVAVRQILEQSGKVLAVLQGHYHKNYYREINGIHYCTLAAMIEGSGKENSAYARLDILPDHTLRITGFRTQAAYEWK
jgi:UDP-2,3-diacylglucosamine pyrophosphatase LpxH